ncbi:MAG TPA: hypothetical protein PKW33_03955 [Anaerolineaceae bacterium]|nr:hypothetical protein [Anaerolineaceae bacterium]HPN50716.1 hypothetical protein [Anaerolineaceae bacterium]
MPFLRRLERARFSPVLWLTIALVHGLLYLFLIPPWQHYDEPGHFEYAWLAAHQASWPQPGDADEAMQRELTRSLIANGFDRGWARPLSADQPWIGVAQVGDKPLYYALAALPLRMMPDAPLEIQLYAARGISLLLYLLSVLAGWGAVKSLLPPEHSLRWMVPAGMALLPGYVDLMTSVNNDAAAAAFSCVFLWAASKMLMEKPDWKNLLLLGLSLAACFLSKATAYGAFVLLGLAIFLRLVRQARWIWLCLGVGLLASLGLVFQYGDAAGWGVTDYQDTPTAVLSSAAPVGNRVLQVDGWRVYQYLPVDQWDTLRGKTVTLGGYVWADVETTGAAPEFACSNAKIISSVFRLNTPLSTKPVFLAGTFNVPEDCLMPMVILYSRLNGRAYYDGVVLAEGTYSAQAPDYAAGLWGGQPFANLLQNASFETTGFRLSWLAVKGVDKLTGMNINNLTYNFTLLPDWLPVMMGYVRTFWGQFGWGNIPLPGSKPYLVLALLSLLGAVGSAVLVVRQRRQIRFKVLLLLVCAFGLPWLVTLMRFMKMLPDMVDAPVARYAVAAIIPGMLLLCAGWREVMGWLRLKPALQAGLFLAGFALLDVLAVLGIIQYFQ